MSGALFYRGKVLRALRLGYPCAGEATSRSSDPHFGLGCTCRAGWAILLHSSQEAEAMLVMGWDIALSRPSNLQISCPDVMMAPYLKLF